MQIDFIPIDKIVPNPRQPRKSMDEEKLASLGDSIKSHDLLQPITVELLPDGGYQILLGHRRWQAFKNIGVNKIPAIVRKNVSDLEGREISLIENWHREKIADPDEENYIAELYHEGVDAGRYSCYEDMAKKTGIPVETLRRIIEGNRVRKRLGVSAELTYQDIAGTAKIKEDETARAKILDLRAQKKIDQNELPKYSEVVKKSTEPVKKALLKNEPSITPEIAEEILTIQSTEEQAAVISQIERRGLTGEKAKVFTQTVREASEPVKKAMLKEKTRITPEIARQVMTLEKREDQQAAIEQVETLRLDEEEAKTIIERHKAFQPEINAEAWQEIQKGYDDLQKELEAKFNTPDVKYRGFLFRNWVSHRYFLGGIKDSFCPHCGREHSGHVVWNCCGLDVDKAYEESKREFQTALNEQERAKKGLGGDKRKK